MYHKYSAIDLVVWKGVICYYGCIKGFVDVEDDIRTASDEEKDLHRNKTSK